MRWLVLLLRIVAVANLLFMVASLWGMLGAPLPGNILLTRAANTLISGLWTSLVAWALSELLMRSNSRP
jgi:hypothetical protein